MFYCVSANGALSSIFIGQFRLFLFVRVCFERLGLNTLLTFRFLSPRWRAQDLEEVVALPAVLRFTLFGFVVRIVDALFHEVSIQVLCVWREQNLQVFWKIVQGNQGSKVVLDHS